MTTTASADNATAAWFALTGTPGEVYRCESGGFLVEVGECFPVWRKDMGAVRSLLLERDLASANPNES
jgi:hypothetical protein